MDSYNLLRQSELVVFGQQKTLREARGKEKSMEGEEGFKNSKFLNYKFQIQDFGFFINFQIPNHTLDSQS